jgi:flavin-dependent dehydrogenase
MPAGVAALERMGLASEVGGAPFYGVRYVFPKFTMEGRFPSSHGLPVQGRGQRRLYLDGMLFAEASKTSGVEAHCVVTVQAPLVENGRVTGLIVEGEERRGDLVVAADGLNSPIRRALGLNVPPRRRRFGLRTHYRVKPGCEQPSWVDVFPRRGYELYVTPLPDREVLVAALVEPGALKGPADREFTRWVNAEPELAERVAGAEQISPLTGCSPLGARASRGSVPGAVLLGDAAGFMDPITGSGMAQALVTAELLSKYVVQKDMPEKIWMRKFECERYAVTRDSRMVTYACLWLARHPGWSAAAYQSMRATPALFSQLLSVSGGACRLWRTQTAF